MPDRIKAWAMFAPGQRRLHVEDLYSTQAAAWRQAREELRYEGYEAGATEPPMPTIGDASRRGYRVLPAFITVEARSDDA